MNARPPDPAASPRVRGTAHAVFAFDVGFAIDLDLAEAIVARRGDQAGQRESLKLRRRTPRYFQYKPAPLRITRHDPTVTLRGQLCASIADLILYDFGAVAVTYSISLDTDLVGLLDLADLLYENPLLMEDARHQIGQLVSALAEAVSKPNPATLVEDYVIYEITGSTGPELEALLVGHRADLARVLRAERGPLSTQEIDEALSCRVSYGPDDAAIIDWNAALVFDTDSEDTRAVLEFANVELLEMRHLDDQLDGFLNRAYEAASRRRWGHTLLSTGAGRELRDLARLQAESAVLFESVNNTLKLMGDQYLSRIYRMASQRLHLSEWDASILRKLATLESIYEKMNDAHTHRRTEFLEWVVIILIALELIIPFVIAARH